MKRGAETLAGRRCGDNAALFVLNERFISVSRNVNVRAGISVARNPMPLARADERRARGGWGLLRLALGPHRARRRWCHYMHKRKIRDAADSSPRPRPPQFT